MKRMVLQHSLGSREENSCIIQISVKSHKKWFKTTKSNKKWISFYSRKLWSLAKIFRKCLGERAHCFQYSTFHSYLLVLHLHFLMKLHKWGIKLTSGSLGGELKKRTVLIKSWISLNPEILIYSVLYYAKCSRAFISWGSLPFY